MRRTAAATLFAWSALAAVWPLAARAGFDLIEGKALGVSADGCAVVGSAVQNGSQAFRWQNGVSTLLFEDPFAYSTANGISANGEVVVGQSNGSRAYRLDAQGPSLLSLPAGTPHEALAVSADGQSIGGCVHALQNGMHCDWPFYWRDGVGTLLRDLTGGFSDGAVNALSSDGLVVAGGAGGSALLWRPAEDGVQDLGKLPGHLFASVRALTPDAAIAVGTSRASSASSARAFRWTAASGMVDLGPATRVARAVSADGKRIVGEGEFDGVEQAFIWDALHGARPLADVLRDEYGFDVGGSELTAATAVSPDGKTIVGIGSDPNGSQGWRARLREEPCPPQTGFQLLMSNPDVTPPLGRIEQIASDSPARVYLSAGYGHFLRLDVEADGSAGPPVPLPDLWSGSNPMLLRPGPDGIYAGGGGFEQLFRIGPDGTASLVFDGAAWPPLPPVADQMPTIPLDLAVAPDGTLFVAAYSRLVRIEPDGSARVLIDAIGAITAMDLGYAGITRVARGADGRLLVLFPSHGVLILDGDTGEVLRARRDLSWGQGLASDPDGGFWLHGYEGVAHYSANGARKLWFPPGEIPDGADGTAYLIDQLVVDERGDAYYYGWSEAESHSIFPFLARITPEGVSEQILGWGVPSGSYQGFSIEAMHVSHRMLYLGEAGSIRRMALPPIGACANGLDDDGDGAADYPADKGCLSRVDDGERSFELPCDNGIDDDQDGVSDFPADPGCVSLTGPYEQTECDDGLDNDGDGSVDWDGKVDEWGNEYPPDSECAGDARRVIEHPWYCGLGFEVALVVLPLTQALRRWRRRRANAEQRGSA